MKWPDLREMLEDIPWAVVGAVATRLYMPERSTQDLDIVVAVSQSAQARGRFAQSGWTQLGQPSIGGTAWRSPQGVEVDMIEAREEWWPAALLQAQANRDASGLPILPFPYLVLMKFRAVAQWTSAISRECSAWQPKRAWKRRAPFFTVKNPPAWKIWKA